VPPYVVQRRTDRRGQLRRRFFQPNGLGWHRYRHPLRLGHQDEGAQVHVIARGRSGRRRSAPDQQAQRRFLLSRQAAELGRLAARLGPAPLD
jgi:hypothetical protein